MPLATFERDGLKAALRRAGLPCGPLFWRFDTDDDIPAGFAGLVLTPEPDYFARAGYAALSRDAVPEAIRASSQFQSPICAAAAAMIKELD